MQFPGTFETHLTIALAPHQSLPSLKSFADRQRFKLTHIVLARGNSPSQPMLTGHNRGTLATELADADHLTALLAAEGFQVTRVKIEVPTDAIDVPRTAADIPLHPPERYFESHVKLLLPLSADLARLTAIAQSHAAHLSRNALRTRPDNFHERFITRRSHEVTRDTAHAQLESLLAALAAYNILEVEEEFVVHDTNRPLDAGWLKDPP